jgi:hypothetical protein
MPLLDHFHPPLRGPRHWESFHHAWATHIAEDLNRGVLPADYFAEPEFHLGPNLEIDVAGFERNGRPTSGNTATATWAPPKPNGSFKVDYSRLDVCEVRVYQELGGAQLRAAIELVSPANKDRPGSRQTFAAKCAGYLKQAVALVIIDVVTERTANLHAELMKVLEVPGSAWKSATKLYAVAYRPVTVIKKERIEVWTQALSLGKPLPVMPLWLNLDLCVPVPLEETYAATCTGLRIPAVV